MRILIVEDDPEQHDLYEMVLNEKGLQAEAVSRSKTALEKLREKRYDVLLTDLRLPDIPGTELLKTVRETDPELLTFIMTAHANVEKAVPWFQLGIEDYFLKPFSFKEMEIKIRAALVKRGLREAKGELEERVLERTRELEDTHRPGGGTGMGLSVSREVVSRHGGVIHIESAGKDRGARVTVQLPLGLREKHTAEDGS